MASVIEKGHGMATLTFWNPIVQSSSCRSGGELGAVAIITMTRLYYATAPTIDQFQLQRMRKTVLLKNQYGHGRTCPTTLHMWHEHLHD